mmetsp:Transcript_21860/g.86789  ORF Transcript_21860/g.86789 Transcript_21860/m.86789 type:complete len:211 (+) Transcript_21860:1713-2345(+)
MTAERRAGSSPPPSAVLARAARALRRVSDLRDATTTMIATSYPNTQIGGHLCASAARTPADRHDDYWHARTLVVSLAVFIRSYPIRGGASFFRTVPLFFCFFFFFFCSELILISSCSSSSSRPLPASRQLSSSSSSASAAPSSRITTSPPLLRAPCRRRPLCAQHRRPPPKEAGASISRGPSGVFVAVPTHPRDPASCRCCWTTDRRRSK